MHEPPEESTWLLNLRALIPKRPLTRNEARYVIEKQAACCRQALGVTTPELPQAALERLPGVEITTLDNLPASGSSTWHHGHWTIAVSGRDSWPERRLAVAHELAHVINHGVERWLCALGPLDERQQQREELADHFAHCLLIPETNVRQLVGQGTQYDDLAGIFGVPIEHIATRLTALGVDVDTHQGYE